MEDCHFEQREEFVLFDFANDIFLTHRLPQ